VSADAGRPVSRLALVLAAEGRLLLADRSLSWVGLLLVGLIVYALGTGFVDVGHRDHASEEVLRADDQRLVRTIDRLGRVMRGEEAPEPFANPADPASVGSGMAARHAVLPSAALAPIALGQSDMIANAYKVSTRSRNSFLHEAEIENPWNLLSGRFDLAFVLTWLLPLLIFALGYNLLSAEREQGSLRLLLSQPLRLSTLMLGKLAIRALSVIGLAVVVPLILLLIARPEAFLEPLSLAMWLALIVAYALFWFALVALVNALGRSSAFNALALIGLWVLIVLVAPLLLNLAVSAASPAPSRAELATRMRLIVNDKLSRHDALLGSEYRYVKRPEALLPKDGRFEVSDRTRAFFLLGQEMDQLLQDAQDRFDAQLGGQQRLVDRWGFLSPAVVAHEGMAALAGNGSLRYLAFQQQVAAFHERWRAWFEPRILDGIAITEADFAQMPRWQWQEPPASLLWWDAALRLAQLLALTLLLGVAALRRLRRYPVV
jgi:ABC-2 type transport system permease protein